MSKNSVLEVEEKFWLANDAGFDDFLLDLGYQKGEIEYQDDIYFSDLSGSYVKQNTCLRIRSVNDNNFSLDYKGPSVDINASTISKIERNLLLSSGSDGACEELLGAIGFSRHVKVRKERLTYTKIQNGLKLSVAIDEVVGLGRFLELEITTNDQLRRDDAIYALSGMRILLSKFLGDVVVAPYRDMVAKKKFNEVFGSTTKVVAFDLDGTLIPNTNHIFYSAWNEISKEKYDLPLEFEQYLRLEVHGNEGLFDFFRKKMNLRVSREDYFQPIYELYNRRLSEWTSLGGFSKFFLPLELLHGRYGMALVTHSKRKFVLDLLERCNASCLFDLILCREDLSELKPAPDGYLAVASHFLIDSSNILVVEDSVKGVAAAKSAGAKVVVIDDGKISSGFDGVPKIGSCAELALLSLAEL